MEQIVYVFRDIITNLTSVYNVLWAVKHAKVQPYVILVRMLNLLSEMEYANALTLHLLLILT